MGLSTRVTHATTPAIDAFPSTSHHHPLLIITATAELVSSNIEFGKIVFCFTKSFALVLLLRIFWKSREAPSPLDAVLISLGRTK